MVTKLIHNDAFQVIKNIENNSLDAVITDPPYALRTIYSSCSKKLKYTWADYINSGAFYSALVKDFGDKMKDNAFMLIFSNWQTYPLYQKAAMDNGYVVSSVLVWDKKTLGLGPKKAVRPSHELVLFIAKGSPVINNRHFRNIYELPFCAGNRTTKHPAEKPVQIMKDLIALVLPDGGTILDPFMGSGTTGAACQELGKKYDFIGIEAEQEYFEIAKNRLK